MGRYAGKYSKKKRIPLFSWLLLGLAAMTLAVGSVSAYLSASTEPVTNSFLAAGSTNPTVVETFQGNQKTNVAVDVGAPGYAVFVRAVVVVTWKNQNGEVLGKAPQAGVDYNITYDTTGTWFQKDGFWYCKAPLAQGNTPDLIVSCSPIDGKTPSGYGLNVEIIAQTIQALGTTDATSETYPNGKPAVTDAWGVAVKNGQLSPD